MIVIGIGSTSLATAANIVAAVHAVEARAGAPCTLIATLLRSGASDAMDEAARALGRPVKAYTRDDLLARSAECLTRSKASLDAHGVASVAEAAALVGAGPGSRLTVARIALGPVTAAAATSAKAEPSS